MLEQRLEQAAKYFLDDSIKYGPVQDLFLRIANAADKEQNKIEIINYSSLLYIASFHWFTKMIRDYWGLPQSKDRQDLSGITFGLVRLCDNKVEKLEAAAGKEYMSAVLDLVRGKSIQASLPAEQILADQIIEKSNGDEDIVRSLESLAVVCARERDTKTFADYLKIREEMGALCGELAFQTAFAESERTEGQKHTCRELGAIGNLFDTILDWKEDRDSGVMDLSNRHKYLMAVPLAAKFVRFLYQNKTKKASVIVEMTGEYAKHILRNKLRSAGYNLPQFEPTRVHPDLIKYLC